MPSLREDHFSILVCPPIKDLKDASDIVYEIEEYFDGNYGPVKYSDTDFYFSFLDEPNLKTYWTLLTANYVLQP